MDKFRIKIFSLVNFRISVLILFYLLISFFTLLKLYVVSSEDILALNQPHDDLWYILAASRKVWFSNTYDLMTIIHLPVFPLYIAFVKLTGVPLRVSLELTYIVAGLFFIYSLGKLKVNKIVCFFSYLLILFHPLSFEQFNHTLAESLYAPLLIISMSSVILLWISDTRRRTILLSCVTGVFLALLWFTRAESPLIMGILATMFALILITGYIGKEHRLDIFNRLKDVLLAPVIIIIIFYLAISTANYYKYGLFAPSEMDSSAYKKAYSALLKIKSKEIVRYVPITSDSRRLAYSISPTFKELEPYLENRNNFAFYWTKESMGIENEMGAGWFYWMLREAVNSAGYKTAKAETLFYERVASEIEKGIKENKIDSRRVLFSFIDPNSWYFLNDSLNSLKKVTGLFVDTNEPVRGQNNILDGEMKWLVDSVANRRAYLVDPRKTTLKGWVFADKGGKVNKVVLESVDRRVISTVPIFSLRPDVISAYNKQNVQYISDEVGFSLETTGSDQILANSLLVFTTTSNIGVSVPYSKLDINVPSLLMDDKSKTKIYYAIDQKTSPVLQNGLSNKRHTQSIVWMYYGKIIVFLTYLGIVSFCVIIFLCRFLDYKKPIYSILAIIFITIIARVLLFTLLDIGSWNGVQPRYLFPIMPIYGAFLLILINQAISLIYNRFYVRKYRKKVRFRL